MFSSPTPAPGSRALASHALRSAGLALDRDATMRDVSDKPSGRKAPSKRSHRVRAIYEIPAKGSSSRTLSARLAGGSDPAGPSDLLSIRGASRPTNGTRPRRNAVSGGVQMGVAPTAVSHTSPPSSRVRDAKGSRTIQHWSDLVKKRYDPQTKCLNLDSIHEDELVRKYNLQAPGIGRGTATEAAVIFKLASRLTPPVETVNLANNGLNGTHLTHLDKYLPKIANLSLQNNNIRSWRDLEPISSRREKLLGLRELVLLGNPLRESEYSAGKSENFKREVLRRIPNLELLDQEAIAKISFDVAQSEARASTGSVPAPTATTFPLEIGPSFIDGVDPSLVSNFLSRFFPAFDAQRPSLGDIYTPASTFSFSANTSIPTRARIDGLHASLPNQRKLEWGPWISSGSRNLQRLNTTEKMVSTMHVGSHDIVQALIKLPLTKHDILGSPENFCVDSFLAGVGLLVVVHGQFIEAPSEGLRSFDRTFMLAPAPEGSRAKLNGWDVVILSDMLTIRALSKPEAWKPGPLLVQASMDTNPPQTIKSLPQDQQDLLNTLPDTQRAPVLQLSGRTGLNVKYSVDCLVGNGWDIERAVANFNQVKATLPQDAFLVIKPPALT